MSTGYLKNGNSALMTRNDSLLMHGVNVMYSRVK